MRSLRWSTSDAVWFTEIDDDHKEIFETVACLQKTLSGPAPRTDVRRPVENLMALVAGHFAHEERLMRAARYPSLAWHKRLHEAAGKQVKQFARRLEQGDGLAASELAEYLSSWLHHHTRVADRMLGSFLRNQLRSLGKMTFRAGTRPADAGGWVNVKGDPVDPLAPSAGF